MVRCRPRTVLITTPSLDRSVNVSGVSSVVRSILESKDLAHWAFKPLIIGKSDSRRRGFLWALSQLSIPFRFMFVIARSRPQLIHINGPLNRLAIPRDALLIAIARLHTKNVIYHLHGGSYITGKPRSKLLNKIIEMMLSLPRIVVVLGHQEADSVTDLYGLPVAQVRVLPNAVAIPSAIREIRTSKPLRVLSLGRLAQEKGLEVLCAAIEEHPELAADVRLQMFGAGPLEAAIIPRLKDALGESFYFGGIAHEAERDAAFAWADVMIMPSLHGEGLPMSLLEAMAAGVVPIVTADGMIANVVHHCQNGYVFEKNSSGAIRQALSTAVQAKTSGALGLLSARAHEIVSQRHSMRSYAHALGDLYRQL